MNVKTARSPGQKTVTFILRKAHFLSRFILAVVLSLVSVTVRAEETAANRDTENIFIQGIELHMPEVYPFLTDTPAGSRGQELFNTHLRNSRIKKESSIAELPSIPSLMQMELQQGTAGFRHYISSFNPAALGGTYSHLRNIFTFISLNTLLSSHSTVMGDSSDHTRLSGAFDTRDTARLTPDLPANHNKNVEEPAAQTPYNDPALKPYIHNPFHDTAISIYLPINLSPSLTIAPAITYVFSTNNTNNQEFKGKGLVSNLIDKDSAIIYGGIHLKFSF